MTATIDRLIYGPLSAVLLATYLGVVAVDAFRCARGKFLAAMAEIDDACCTYDVEVPGVSGGAR